MIDAYARQLKTVKQQTLAVYTSIWSEAC